MLFVLGLAYEPQNSGRLKVLDNNDAKLGQK